MTTNDDVLINRLANSIAFFFLFLVILNSCSRDKDSVLQEECNNWREELNLNRDSFKIDDLSLSENGYIKIEDIVLSEKSFEILVENKILLDSFLYNPKEGRKNVLIKASNYYQIDIPNSLINESWVQTHSNVEERMALLPVKLK